MVRRHYTQRSVFESLLPDGAALWEPTLRQMDDVLDDEALVDLVTAAMRQRRPRSAIRGRPGTPAVVVLRMLLLKHLYDWSFETCERQVRGSLVYRAFCRIGCERVPDATTLVRLAQSLDPEVLKGMLERLVNVARQRRLIRGRRLRVDTTVVETNIRYPSDSRLLADGVRVLTRTITALRRAVGGGLPRFRDRTRSLARCLFQLTQQSRYTKLGRTPAARAQAGARMRHLFQNMMAITRAVVRQAETIGHQLAARRQSAGSAPRGVEPLGQRLAQTVGLVRRVLTQTRARILQGDTRAPDKVLSLFEPQTDAIRKGKVARPTEFGKVVKVQEAERQFITDYAVCATRVPDQDLWQPSLAVHRRLFGHPPDLAVADAGFATTDNERAATALGVRRVVLPQRGRLSARRRAHQQQRWFRRGLRWRTGCEGRISALKRRHGLRRCRYRGPAGMARWVGLGAIANNLYVFGRAGPGTP